MKHLLLVFCLMAFASGATPVGFDVQRGRRLWVSYRSFTREPERAAQFAAMGVTDRCFFAANTRNAKGDPYCDYPPIWLGYGRYDWSALDAQMEDILRAAPDVRLICIIDLNTPPWATRLLNVDSFTDLTHAACDADWRTKTEEWMLDFIAYAERKWGRHIGAYMLSGGSTSEWYEFDKGRTSEKKDAAWVAWCQARGLDYGKSVPTRPSLAEASFENVVYDPATEPEKIEYWKFHNSLPADALLGFAKAARAAIPKEKELGAFFGYFFVGAPRYTSYGHLDCARVLGSPDLDFFSAPGNYQGRGCGGGSGSPIVDGTVLRFGKRFLHEIDFGTHDQSRWNPGDSTSLADDLAIHTREAAFAMSKNANYWWFDMWGGFYRNPTLRARIADLRRVQDNLPDAPSVSQVLLVADQESLYCVNERAEGVKAFGRDLRNELAKTGAPYDTCSFADLPALDLSPYRLVILNSTVLITPERERMLREKVFNSGRTVLWTYAPGLSDGRMLDVGRVRRFAGVDYKTPGVSVTDQGGWTAVYAHDYKLYTTAKLAEIETCAGVHRYVEPCTPVFAKANFVAVHTREGGDLAVKLPRKAVRVTDLLTGDVMATDADAFRTSFSAPDTRLFKVDYATCELPSGTALAAPDAEHAPQTRKHQGIPSVAVSKVNGRMWCSYYCDPLGGENHLNYCVLATSADDGRTWKEVLVADPDGAGLKRAFDPEVWIAPDGKLRWTWTERTLDPAKTDLMGSWNGYSNIESDTLFVAELNAENEPKAPYASGRPVLRGVMMCKPTVVGNGDWVFPLCEWNGAPSSKFYATRDGRNFRYLGGVTLPKDWRQFDEQQMVELSDGRWWTLIRTAFGLCESFSSDGGKTWSAPVESKLGHPNSRLFLSKLPSGNLLLVKHGKIGERPEGGKWKVRKNLRAFVSSDDGKTWAGGLLLDERKGVAYPDGDIGADGRIAVVYDHNRTHEKEVLMARFKENDVSGSGDSLGKVELRQPVSRPSTQDIR